MTNWMDTVDAVRLRAVRLQGARSRRVDTPLGPLHALDWRGKGPRPPIALFHGLASCAADYAPLMRILRRRHRRVIAADLPGHGSSPTPDGPLTAERLTAAMVALMDALVDEPVIVFGNSLGGIAAIRYAQARPEQVRALILVSPGGAPMDPERLAAFKRIFDLTSQADALAFIRRVLGQPQPMMSLLARGARLRMARPGPRNLLDNVTPEVLLRAEDVARLHPPTLIMWGDEDEVLPVASRRFFSANLPAHARFEALPGFGHTPYMDDLPAFARRVHAFVDQLGDGLDGAEPAR